MIFRLKSKIWVLEDQYKFLKKFPENSIDEFTEKFFEEFLKKYVVNIKKY